MGHGLQVWTAERACHLDLAHRKTENPMRGRYGLSLSEKKKASQGSLHLNKTKKQYIVVINKKSYRREETTERSDLCFQF